MKNTAEGKKKGQRGIVRAKNLTRSPRCKSFVVIKIKPNCYVFDWKNVVKFAKEKALNPLTAIVIMGNVQ